MTAPEQRISAPQFATVTVWNLWLLAALATANPVHASVIDCTTNTYVVHSGTGNVTLTSSDVLYTTSSTNDCVRLDDGRDLNLNGAIIECRAASGYCDDAVRATSAASVLQGGSIEGPFTYGARNVEEVKNVTIDGSWRGISGEDYGRRVFGNVIRNVFDGIYLHSLASSSYIKDNAIELAVPQSVNQFVWYGWAIRMDGASAPGPQIETNYIRDFGGTASSGLTDGGGIIVDTDMDLTIRILGNVLERVDGDPILYSSDPPTLTNNTCDDASTCPVPAAPFTLP